MVNFRSNNQSHGIGFEIRNVCEYYECWTNAANESNNKKTCVCLWNMCGMEIHFAGMATDKHQMTWSNLYNIYIRDEKTWRNFHFSTSKTFSSFSSTPSISLCFLSSPPSKSHQAFTRGQMFVATFKVFRRWIRSHILKDEFRKHFAQMLVANVVLCAVFTELFSRKSRYLSALMRIPRSHIANISGYSHGQQQFCLQL